ncbi:MAG TPA: hypothetical protein VG826_34895 [Pirellulales bacterium]|nr:hypothetical protein [Pirellulales bacterium]
MRGFHFSLRWLFGIVSFLAVGCGLLIYASPFLSKLTATSAAVVLLAAIPAAIYHAGERRAFWAGFAFFGFAYLWLVCGAWQSHDGSGALRERLVTTDLLVRGYAALPSTQSSSSANSTLASIALLQSTGTVVIDPNTGQAATASGGGSSTWTPTPVAVAPPVDRADFLTTGHSLFAILFALLGAAITRRCCSRARAVSSAP